MPELFPPFPPGAHGRESPLTVIATREGESTVLIVRGEIDRTNAYLLGNRGILALDEGAACLVLDLSEVTFLDAGGVHVLSVLCLRAGGADRLVLREPSGIVLRILELTAPLIDGFGAPFERIEPPTRGDGALPY